jgi:hexosaminidase
MPEGAYQLEVGNNGIEIIAASEKGLFYGIQSLRQLLVLKGGQLSIAYLTIKDQPRFNWRAYMLDEGRYFKGKKQVKKLLDEMARLKMNIFHWHLVDDQGWRVEIKKYPLLTEIGSKRVSTQVGPLQWQSPIQSGEPHEGFYTQDEIREIVEYARVRHITVVPEIEMPGHSSAAIAAYTWLGSKNEDIEVPTVFGVSKDVYNVADPKVIQFLTDVLDEVMELFPSKVIHIGGDEVKYDNWKASAPIQDYMQEHDLKSPADLQIFFTNRISNYLQSKGRRMMGWNEIMGHNLHHYQDDQDTETSEQLSKSSVIHFWKGDLELIKTAVQNGFDAVNSLHSSTYLDYTYESISLKKAYHFDPIPEGLEVSFHQHIIGMGCQMWGEWIPSPGYMDFQTFPRIAAFAEVGWTHPGQKDFEGFLMALKPMLEKWDEVKIYYAPLEVASGEK